MVVASESCLFSLIVLEDFPEHHVEVKSTDLELDYLSSDLPQPQSS